MAGRAAERRIGSVVEGKYLLLAVLGRGGMGAVYRAEHQFTGRHVALKLMHGALAEAPGIAERFLREARAASAIGHGGIVDVLDGGETADGELYIVMELLEGHTLSRTLIEGSLTLGQLCGIAIELLAALGAAHVAGFVHRDVKPENVFLVPRDAGPPEVKLLDFGVVGMLAAAQGSGLTATGAVLGTPAYMSPEQAIGQRVDARTDLWSVGAILYRALAGRAPYRGVSYNETVVAVATQTHTPLAQMRGDLPAALAAVIDRALARDPDERWSDASAMSEALRAALPDAAVRAQALCWDLAGGDGQATAPEQPRARLGANLETAPTQIDPARPRAGKGRRVVAWLLVAAIALGAGAFVFDRFMGDDAKARRRVRPRASAAAKQRDPTVGTVDLPAPDEPPREPEPLAPEELAPIRRDGGLP